MPTTAPPPPPPVGPQQRQFPCKQCGASLVFEPGTNALKCPYCGTVNEIAPPADDAPVRELDFGAFASTELSSSSRDVEEKLVVRCDTCGAETELKPNVTADRCPFCGAGIVAQGQSRRSIKPQGLLPFRVTRQEAGGAFKGWVASRWFAPGDLKQRAEASEIVGVYVPCWTYDAFTTTDYTGQRGDDFWDTEIYTEIVDGRSETRTRQVRRTRWSHASGTVTVPFDDVLVLASRSLPAKQADALEPWDLPALVPYRDEYLSGFVAESYQVSLPDGFEAAKQIMAGPITSAIHSDIGGDHQQVGSSRTAYDDVTFKHALLPVWISAYRYAGRTFRFLVNARTGEVQGERPYSAAKVALFVLMIVVIVAVIVLLANST